LVEKKLVLVNFRGMRCWFIANVSNIEELDCTLYILMGHPQVTSIKIIAGLSNRVTFSLTSLI
jgi:hypothetical protein